MAKKDVAANSTGSILFQENTSTIIANLRFHRIHIGTGNVKNQIVIGFVLSRAIQYTLKTYVQESVQKNLLSTNLARLFQSNTNQPETNGTSLDRQGTNRTVP